MLVLGYLYFYLAGEAYALVSIGLISFSAVAQFAPGDHRRHLLERRHARSARMCGLAAGFLVWVYTLLLPSFAKSGWLPITFLAEGHVRHRPAASRSSSSACRASTTSRTACSGACSRTSAAMSASRSRSGPSAAEHSQATLFVDALKHPSAAGSRFWRGSASVQRPRRPARPLPRARSARRRRSRAYAAARGRRSPSTRSPADAALVHHVESLLAGAIGSASARVMVASVVEEEPLGLDEVLQHHRRSLAGARLQPRSSSRNRASSRRRPNELREANRRLQELDRLKDDFISTVTHELRTPLTSIRAFSEILNDNPELDDGAARASSSASSSRNRSA